MNKRSRNWITMLCVCSVIVLSALSGCRSKQESKAAAAAGETVTDNGPLDKSLKLWAAGKKDKAADALLAVDWKKVTHFAEGSDFSLTKEALRAMSHGDRKKKVAAIIKPLENIRALAKHIVQREDTSETRGNLSALGKLMANERHMLIVQHVGKAINQLASASPAAK